MRLVGVFLAAALLSACVKPQSELDQGFVMLAERDYQAASAHFSAMHAAAPTDPYVNLNLGVALAELGLTDEAAKHYRTAIATGREAQVLTVLVEGQQEQRLTTVKKLASVNLEKLSE
ncbi:MAG: tetratricopeptide repeat protein [Pseudomonadota bacterium]